MFRNIQDKLQAGYSPAKAAMLAISIGILIFVLFFIGSQIMGSKEEAPTPPAPTSSVEFNMDGEGAYA